MHGSGVGLYVGLRRLPNIIVHNIRQAVEILLHRPFPTQIKVVCIAANTDIYCLLLYAGGLILRFQAGEFEHFARVERKQANVGCDSCETCVA